MNIYLLVILRTIHIFVGMLWVGSAIFYLFFVEPTVKSIGPSGQQFMQHLVARQRFPQYMGAVSLLTVLSGISLFWISSGGFQTGWILSGPGIAITIGSLVGISVFLLGAFLIGPTAEKLGGLASEVGHAGGPPNPTQVAELHKLDRRLTLFERADFIMLTFSLLTMVTARFWTF
jgi:uncharacterized membrane protein